MGAGSKVGHASRVDTKGGRSCHPTCEGGEAPWQRPSSWSLLTRRSARSCGGSRPRRPTCTWWARRRTALRLAQALQPDIVLLDLAMPRVNGLEALRRIKAERPATTVIIVTVHAEDAYRQAAADGGADAFLLKKTLVAVLLPTIQRLRGSLPPPPVS